MDGNEIKELRKYIESLGEVIRKYPRKGGPAPNGLNLLRQGKEWTERSADPEKVAELLLGTQFDGKKATASCFKSASLVTAHYGWNLSWKEDFSLGAYLVSCHTKSGIYYAWLDSDHAGRPDYWLAVEDQKALEFTETDSNTAYKPFRQWLLSPKDKQGHVLVKPSHPQLKDTVWEPDATHLRNAYGIDQHPNPSTEKWQFQKARHEEFTRIQPMQWLRAIHALESNAYRINEEILKTVIAIGHDRLNYQRNAQAKHNLFDRTIKKAKELKGKTFYHRAFCDYRGRLYLTDSVLNYQGGDLPRSLIEFAKAKPIHDLDWKYLWLQAANTYGLKGKWEERVEEAKALESNIVRYANNPLETHDEWSQAADKWQFLRACLEIRDALENPHHQSHLICELDQSTSCLQHMALVMDDAEMMEKVNLGPEYSDIYQIIGDDLELEGEVSSQHRRKIVKTALVPFGYGSGVKKIAQAYDESDLPYLVQLSAPGRFQLVRNVVEKIKEHLPSAKTYQEEMAKLASRLIVEGKDHFHWKTSSGFEVHHFKQQQKEQRERILLRTKHSEGEENKYARLVAYEPEVTADREALIRGLAPNFIHSIDASVIHSLLSAHGEVDALVTVHDALGAHASSMHKLTELFYLHLLIIYKGFNPKMYFDESMLGINIPILQMERGISEEATNLLIQSQHALT